VLEHSGIVRAMNSRTVVIEGWGRRRIHIPNRTVLDNPLVNHTKRNTRRSGVEVRLRVGDDLDEAVSAVIETVADVPGVIADQRPNVVIRSVDPGRLVIVVRFAHGPSGPLMVTSDVVRAIAVAERARGRDVTVTAPPQPIAQAPKATI
jgi:small conductance mechanosensitive channel